ncbi:MAG: metal ABC transporter permease [Rhodobacteraceae bacterium]|nr:metal ABC transporter permease [Paracoccaceae bacterium]
MRNAFLIAGLIAVPTALLSCFLVLKGWSLMGDAVSHAVLPGIVLAYILGLPLLPGAFAAGLFCALATGWIRDNSRIRQDTVMGVVFSGMFGLGIVLYVAFPSELHLDHILFGNMLGVDGREIATSGGIALLVTLVLLARWRDILLHAFDPVQARVSGLPVAAIHYGLLVILSLTIVATLSAVGIILAIALLIAPGAIAFLLAGRMQSMLAAAVLVNLAACLAGVHLSFFLDSAPAPTIVLILTAAFVSAFAAGRIRAARAQRAGRGAPAQPSR